MGRGYANAPGQAGGGDGRSPLLPAKTDGKHRCLQKHPFFMQKLKGGSRSSTALATPASRTRPPCPGLRQVPTVPPAPGPPPAPGRGHPRLPCPPGSSPFSSPLSFLSLVFIYFPSFFSLFLLFFLSLLFFLFLFSLFSFFPVFFFFIFSFFLFSIFLPPPLFFFLFSLLSAPPPFFSPPHPVPTRNSLRAGPSSPGPCRGRGQRAGAGGAVRSSQPPRPHTGQCPPPSACR